MHRRIRNALIAASLVSLAWAVPPASAVTLKTTVLTIANPSPAADANFGWSVVALGDVNGDGTADFAAGAPGSDHAYIFSGATRTLLRTIADPQNKPGNAFGFALANVGDINADGVTDLAVGARGVDQFLPLPCPIEPCNAMPEQGRAFVFSGATGALLRTLSPGGVEFLAFGFSLAGLGDVSGDGIPDIAVGAPTFLNNRFGQVYAFSGATGAVLWIAKEGQEALASFGFSVASVGDRNGDGRSDLLVGAIFHDTDPGAGTSLDGRAYLLSGATGAEIRHIENPLGTAGENFGLGLTALGDQTGDGAEDDAISDPAAARVHLFNGATGAGAGTIATTGATTDNFGFDLAPSGDRDGDGKPDLWAGAPGAGRVDLVNASGSVLLTIPDPTPGGSAPLGFGFSIAATPDLGGDAGSDLLVGEPGAAAGQTAGAGAVHLVLIAANQPPIANAGTDSTAECASPTGTAVLLDGSASSDPDGDPLTYEWRDATNTVVGTTAVVGVSVTPGAHSFTLTVSDGFGGTDSDSVVASVADTTDPLVSVAVSPTTLWPPNHRLVAVTATVSATDACAGSLPVVLESIVSSEPDNGLGDGDTAGDIQGAVIGTGDFAFELRAERAGGGSGRTYTVTYGAVDPAGNDADASATARVPSSGAK